MKTGFPHNQPRCTHPDSLIRVALHACTATLALLLAGCSIVTGPTLTGSGNLVTKQYPFTNLTSVSVGNVFDVTVKPGPAASVSVTVDDNLVDYLDALCWTQTRLAQEARISVGTVGRVVQGKTVSRQSADAICRTLSERMKQTIELKDIDGLYTTRAERPERRGRASHNHQHTDTPQLN